MDILTHSVQKNMNWDDLKIVLAIHRGGSMSKAAKLLGIDHSTVTRRLTAIERDLGAVLFVRSKLGLTANDAGQVAIEQAIAIERQAERLVDRLPHRSAVPQGSVRLLSNPWILTHLAGHGLATLRRDYPQVELVMIGGTQKRGIAIGETDLALWFEIEPGDGEFAVPLCDVPYAVYAPAGADPAATPWMTFWDVKERRAPMRWLAQQVPPGARLALKTSDAPALVAAIGAGLGQALVPVCLAARAQGVMRVPGIDEVRRKLHLHAHPDLVQSPRVQAVMGWLRAVVPSCFADPGGN